MRKIAVRTEKDNITVEDFQERENQSERRNAEVRIPALKFARKLFD